MNGPRDYHTKWSKSSRNKYYMISLPWGILKKWFKGTYLQNRKRLTDIDGKLILPKEKGGKGKIRDLGLKDTHYYA